MITPDRITKSIDKRLLILEYHCNSCDGPQTVHVTPQQYDAWLKGLFAQKAFPHLSADTRELMMSGTCGKCFDRLFGADV